MNECHVIPVWASFTPDEAWQYGQYLAGGPILARDISGWAGIARIGNRELVIAMDDSGALYPLEEVQ